MTYRVLGLNQKILRCSNCGRKLLELKYVGQIIIDIKCPRCKETNNYKLE